MSDISKFSELTSPVEFVSDSASHQNACDLFKGKWIGKVPGFVTGARLMFGDADLRPAQARDAFGDMTDWEVLELGSFEGAHTYQLEQLGANVVAVEANPHIFMRSLVVKNALGMKSEFLLGDFLSYLESPTKKFDMVFASGMLYHMTEPFELLYRIAQCAKHIFIWTHYVPDQAIEGWKAKEVVDRHGFSGTHFRYEYPQRASRSYGGIKPHCNRMSRMDMLAALEAFGFTEQTVVLDNIDHPGGAAITVAASKPD